MFWIHNLAWTVQVGLLEDFHLRFVWFIIFRDQILNSSLGGSQSLAVARSSGEEIRIFYSEITNVQDQKDRGRAATTIAGG